MLLPLNGAYLGGKKKHSLPFHPPFPSKVRCFLSPTGILNSGTTLLRVACKIIFPFSLSLRAFRVEECLCPSDRNYILMA